jgi:hypothetical protein
LRSACACAASLKAAPSAKGRDGGAQALEAQVASGTRHAPAHSPLGLPGSAQPLSFAAACYRATRGLCTAMLARSARAAVPTRRVG